MHNSLTRNKKPTAGIRKIPCRCRFFFAMFLLSSWLFPGLFFGHPRAEGPYETLVAGEEYKVKAAFVFGFGRYTKWPKGAFKDDKSPMIICVVSDNPKVPEFFKSVVSGKTIEGRKVIIKSVNENNREMEGCHILYLNTDNREIILEKLNAVNKQGVLTVGEIEDFAKMCGIITFSIKENRVRFHINKEVGKRAGFDFAAGMQTAADKLFEKGCGE